LLNVNRCAHGVEHPGTLANTCNLADSRSGQAKHAEAEQMLRSLLDVQ
jgi:hypothetical protein